MTKQWFSHNTPCQDHLGNIYPSIKDMCKVYNINPETYSRRIKVYHMTVAEALTNPVKHNGGMRCQDHHGKYYKSRTKMCENYGINRKLFEYRIKKRIYVGRSTYTSSKRKTCQGIIPLTGFFIIYFVSNLPCI